MPSTNSSNRSAIAGLSRLRLVNGQMLARIVHHKDGPVSASSTFASNTSFLIDVGMPPRSLDVQATPPSRRSLAWSSADRRPCSWNSFA